MIEDFHQKLNEEIHTESRDREFNNEALLKVLEETCNAIDKDVSFKSTWSGRVLHLLNSRF